MTIKSRLNIIALSSVGAMLALLGILLYNTFRIDDQLRQVRTIKSFTEQASKLNMVTEQYLAYGEQRHLTNWNDLYKKLNRTKPSIVSGNNRKVISNTLASIHDAFNLIKRVKTNQQSYSDQGQRKRLLNRAKARIRSDIQTLMSVAHSLSDKRQQSVHQLQVNRQTYILIILIPAILFIGYLTFKTRQQIIDSLSKLLNGTQQIANGNLDTHIHIPENNEHQMLAREFNEMTRQLQRHIEREKTARREAEETRKRWERLVHQDPNLIMITVNGIIKFMNPAGANICGAEKPEEMIDRSAFDMITKQQEEKAHQRIQQVQSEAMPASATIYKIHRLDQKERYLQLESRPTTYKGKNAMQSVGLDITDHITYENKLEEALNEKTLLLQEVHHRVKNNLAIVSSLLQMQRYSTVDERLSAMLSESERRIKSIALIHEALYHSDSLTSVRIDHYIEKLIPPLREAFDPEQKIHVSSKIESVNLNVNQAVPCALLLNELLSIAYKHNKQSQNDHGNISLESTMDGEQVTFEVIDHAEVIPVNQDTENDEQIDKTIIDTLVKQLQAEYKVIRSNGITMRITFTKEEKYGSGSAHL